MIKSNQNQQFKFLKSLSRKRTRQKERKYIVEGFKLVEEAAHSGVLEKVYLKEGVDFSIDSTTEVFLKELFTELSSLENPEGILGLCRMEDSKKLKEKILYLDEIRDPGNLGTMIRTAEAFGYSVLISKKSVDLYNEKVLRGTMGSVFRVPIRTEQTVEDLKKLKKEGFFLYGTFLDGETSFEKKDKHILIIGSESHGIQESVEDVVDEKIKISMEGQVESLNASMSAGILMHYFSKK